MTSSLERRPSVGTVFVVDDDPLVRSSTERVVLAAGLRVQVFASAREFLDTARPEAPACMVLDVHMPDLSGLDLQEELTRIGREGGVDPIPIIFISGGADIPLAVRAIKAGAVQFFTKPYRPSELLEAIHAALEQDRMARRAGRALAILRQRYGRLTPREREVMGLVVAGLLGKEIAQQLGTSERTVKFHRANIMRKMKARSLPALVRMATDLRIPRPP